jgi:AraC family transcriptional regulator
VAITLSSGALFGERLRGSRIGWFKLSERSYPPRLKTPEHAHKWSFLCLVLEGAYTETRGHRTRVCHAATLLFHPQGEVHVEHFHETGARLFVVEIEPRWLKRTLEHSLIAALPSDLYKGLVATHGRRLYKEFLAADGISPLVVEGLILQIIGEAARHAAGSAAGNAPHWLQQARELLNKRFAEHLHLEDIAAAVQVHPVHLAQMFQKHYRCTVGAYIRRLRIDFACRELANTEAPLVDIALAAGFCDQSHFTKTFRRHTGQVPSQFRESIR